MTPSTVWKFCGLLVGIAVFVLWFYPDPQGATPFQRTFLASMAVIVAAVVGVVVWARTGCLVVTVEAVGVHG